MTTTFRVRSDEIDASLIEKIKAAYPHALIEIAVNEVDETDSLLADAGRRERLLRAVADVEAGRNVVVPDQTLFR